MILPILTMDPFSSHHNQQPQHHATLQVSTPTPYGVKKSPTLESLHIFRSIRTMEGSSVTAPDATTSAKSVALTIGSHDIYLNEDWTQGIGGGLWSTGLALAKYFDTEHAQRQLRSLGIKRVLELGSGNGFLAVCLLASLTKNTLSTPTAATKDDNHSSDNNDQSLSQNYRLDQLIVTDTKEHVALMKSTVFDGNAAIIESCSSTEVIVAEYLWGKGPITLDTSKYMVNDPTFDMIVGSDLAYRDELHDPLIATLNESSGPDTVTLLGVTMSDTKPIFFAKLAAAGFQYERLADHLLDPNFRGRTFGIFVIRRRRSSPIDHYR